MKAIPKGHYIVMIFMGLVVLTASCANKRSSEALPEIRSEWETLNQEANELYAVEDRTPRVYPWLNEPGGGILREWKPSRPRIASTVCNTT